MPLPSRAWALGMILCGCVACALAQTEPGGVATTAPDKVEKIKITIGKDTTFVSGPVRADGTVDYLAAYDAKMRAGVTVENNAFVPLLRIFGPKIISDKVLAQMLERLGIAELPADGSYFQSMYDYLSSIKVVGDSRNKFYDQIDEARMRPWTAGEFPELAGWLERNEKPLDGVVEASKRERYYYPSMTGNVESLVGMLLPGLVTIRETGEALALRAAMRAGEGNIKQAGQDALTIHRLARLVSQRDTLLV